MPDFTQKNPPRLYRLRNLLILQTKEKTISHAIIRNERQLQHTMDKGHYLSLIHI